VSIEIHGKKARLTVTDTGVQLTTYDGRDSQNWQYEDDEQMVADRLLASFAQSLQDPADNAFAGLAAESLRDMAVLESAYLSARTGFPEEPARILQRAGNSTGAGTSV
jgi:predicted dehydrogenase